MFIIRDTPYQGLLATDIRGSFSPVDQGALGPRARTQGDRAVNGIPEAFPWSRHLAGLWCS